MRTSALGIFLFVYFPTTLSKPISLYPLGQHHQKSLGLWQVTALQYKQW